MGSKIRKDSSNHEDRERADDRRCCSRTILKVGGELDGELLFGKNLDGRGTTSTFGKNQLKLGKILKVGDASGAILATMRIGKNKLMIGEMSFMNNLEGRW